MQKQTKTNVQGDHFKYYKVFYSKDVNKKKRVFSQGIIACQNRKTRLFNSDGEVLLLINQKNEPEIEEQYVLGHKYAVVIEAQVEKQVFTSGKIFIPCAQIPLPKVQVKKVVNKIKQTQKVTKAISNLQKMTKKQTQCLKNNLQIQSSLYSKLRQHQIHGIQFMYDCLLGYKGSSICGCILADFMGLGKTLQTITLVYSLLKMKQIFKCIVITPLTLVGVWDRQCKKWLDGKLNPIVALGGDNEELKNICRQFANSQYRMLVLSYQSFYKFIDILDKKCDLVIFDQGHRLKNKNSKLYRKILNFSCRKRILLTGTPLQNNLDQLYTCISIVNPSLFGSDQLFKNVFQKPILIGMAKKATTFERQIAMERTLELANKIKEFSLRRKADTLEKYLPIKRQYCVLFKLTQLQKLWYERLCKKKEGDSDVLSSLNLMRKLFTHPHILRNDRLQRQQYSEFSEDTTYQTSFKMQFILDLCALKSSIKQKVIIVSYFTSTLDFISERLKQNKITYCKLDGRSDGKDRLNIVTTFQNQKDVLLLSGKAGGTGLTLVSAYSMILVQPDWNPSNDAQVIGRIWRQGQQHQVDIYRLLIISSFEQRIIQRQKLKQYLAQKLIDQSKVKETTFDFLNMKKLFVEAGQKSLIFKQTQNCIQQVKKDNGWRLQWEGVVFLHCKYSHQNLKQNVTNQFQDGTFLLDGLMSKEDNDKQDQNQQFNQETQDIDTVSTASINLVSLGKKKKQINKQQIINSQNSNSKTVESITKYNKKKQQQRGIDFNDVIILKSSKNNRNIIKNEIIDRQLYEKIKIMSSITQEEEIKQIQIDKQKERQLKEQTQQKIFTQVKTQIIEAKIEIKLNNCHILNKIKKFKPKTQERI